ncbi:MAG: hypothetical protein HY300_19225 [Verrucomicrobia bacterium]|nr:hypothetical protein [Verrucomicrobiota bacterium]
MQRIIFSAFFLTIIVHSACADILVLNGGQVVFGTIRSQGNDGYQLQRGTTTIKYANGMVFRSYQRPQKRETAISGLPSWGDVVEGIALKPWGGNLKQIPATVVDKGVLRNVPYLSFRCGVDYEVNIYGDPEQPASIEIGCYRSLLKSAEAKENCIAVIAGLMRNEELKKAVISAKRDKDLISVDEWVVEVTPPEGLDSYGGWWVSVYSEKMLDSQRASPAEMANITVNRAQIGGAANSTSGWSQEDLRFARPASTPPAITPAIQSSPANSGSGPVYVNGYTRKDGTYVHSYTRRR